MNKYVLILVLSLILWAGIAVGASLVLRPPIEYQKDTYTQVYFVDISKVDKTCRAMGAQSKQDHRIDGCANGNTIVLPHPCSFKGFFADVTCHEVGHVNGWYH